MKKLKFLVYVLIMFFSFSIVGEAKGLGGLLSGVVSSAISKSSSSKKSINSSNKNSNKKRIAKNEMEEILDWYGREDVRKMVRNSFYKFLGSQINDDGFNYLGKGRVVEGRYSYFGSYANLPKLTFWFSDNPANPCCFYSVNGFACEILGVRYIVRATAFLKYLSNDVEWFQLELKENHSEHFGDPRDSCYGVPIEPILKSEIITKMNEYHNYLYQTYATKIKWDKFVSVESNRSNNNNRWIESVIREYHPDAKSYCEYGIDNGTGHTIDFKIKIK